MKQKKPHVQYEVTIEEFLAQGTKLYGDDKKKWKFKCPICGNIATPEEYKAAGAGTQSAIFNCIGRYRKDGHPMGEGVPCNYTSGGLLKCNDKWIVDENGCQNGIFMFANEEMPKESKIVPIPPRYEGEAPATNKWEDFNWPSWVPDEVRKQVQDFWGPSMRRGPKDWIDSMGERICPQFGKTVTLHKICGKESATGRYIHAWNNIGRVVHDDGTFDYVSF